VFITFNVPHPAARRQGRSARLPRHEDGTFASDDRGEHAVSMTTAQVMRAAAQCAWRYEDQSLDTFLASSR
jgi:hypothetical protein